MLRSNIVIGSTLGKAVAVQRTGERFDGVLYVCFLQCCRKIRNHIGGTEPSVAAKP